MTIQPDALSGQDVWITSVFSYGDDFGVDDEKLQVGGWGDLYHTLMRFDISALPSRAATATVILQPFSRGDASLTVSMELYRPTASWDETTGWFTRPASVFVAALPAPIVGTPYAIDITSTYNAWKSGAQPNNGFELRPTASNNRFNVFRSSDYRASPTERPKLVIVPASEISTDRFSWPTDPANPSVGGFAVCADNPQCFWLDTPNGWRDVQPFLRYPFTSPSTGKTVYHIGADWNKGTDPRDRGATVHAIGDGTIVSVLTAVPGFGNVIFITHKTTFGEFVSMYAHVDWLAAGQPKIGAVSRGEAIALIGNGSSGGVVYPYHLHLEIRAGQNVTVGRGYADSQTAATAQGQIDPNGFIASHR